MSLKPMKPLMGKNKMTKNEKIALKWALEKVKPNTGLIQSDKFWTGYRDSDKIRKSTASLFRKHDIIIFRLSKEGAILIHKNNPKLDFAEKDGWGVCMYKGFDETDIMLLESYPLLEARRFSENN